MQLVSSFCSPPNEEHACAIELGLNVPIKPVIQCHAQTVACMARGRGPRADFTDKWKLPLLWSECLCLLKISSAAILIFKQTILAGENFSKR